MEPYYQPEDDLLLVQEEMTTPIKYMAVCQNEGKKFPLTYIVVDAICEAEAIKNISKMHPSLKVLKAYPSKG
jgi:hypothetical protein